GKLKVKLFEERDDRPVSGVAVILTGGSRGSMTDITDEAGEASFEVDTPPIAPSMTPAPRVLPYAVFDIRIIAEGYVSVTVVGEQVFDEQTTCRRSKCRGGRITRGEANT
ncbi:MAG: hypothetical protein KBS45_04405, partial [Clostridiales bacterium]|nr:hypothetical protein [Candidatus Coliplasma caballi]